MPVERRYLRVALPLTRGRTSDFGAIKGALAPAAVPELGQLLLDAYHGTIDDEGEDLDAAVREVERVLGGGSGDMLLPHSSVLASESGLLLAAVMVTFWRGFPLISHVVTRPSHQGRGLAEGLLVDAASSLASAGYGELRLWVTKGNGPAERLYARLGFVDVPPAAAQ